jgi:branched-chain amino acid transport system ATP-binding protein
MKDTVAPYTTADGRQIGDVLMDMRGITLRFGGVEAIKDISFDIREGEIRAIIGPNGAGKSSMLNVISGFYNPQDGEVWFRGAKRPPMKPYQVARQGIARTFQNIALFDGMSVLDNIMTGRLTHMKAGCWRRRSGKAGPSAKRWKTAPWSNGSSTFWKFRRSARRPLGACLMV